MSFALGLLDLRQLELLGGAALIGGFVFGIAGFAYGVIASLFLHRAFGAPDVIFIVASGALLLNLSLLPRFWRDIDLRRAAPYLGGAALGLPVGFGLLVRLDPALVRSVIAVLLIAWCVFAIRQQMRAPLRLPVGTRVGTAADVVIGWLGGVVGGISGLGPLIPAIWYGLRGFDKREQRALMQPYGLAVQSVMVVWLVADGRVGPTALQALAIAAPALVGSALLGLRLYDAISVTLFQRLVLGGALVGATSLLIDQVRSH